MKSYRQDHQAFLTSVFLRSFQHFLVLKKKSIFLNTTNTEKQVQPQIVCGGMHLLGCVCKKEVFLDIYEMHM